MVCFILLLTTKESFLYTGGVTTRKCYISLIYCRLLLKLQHGIARGHSFLLWWPIIYGYHRGRKWIITKAIGHNLKTINGSNFSVGVLKFHLKSLTYLNISKDRMRNWRKRLIIVVTSLLRLPLLVSDDHAPSSAAEVFTMLYHVYAWVCNTVSSSSSRSGGRGARVVTHKHVTWLFYTVMSWPRIDIKNKPDKDLHTNFILFKINWTRSGTFLRIYLIWYIYVMKRMHIIHHLYENFNTIHIESIVFLKINNCNDELLYFFIP